MIGIREGPEVELDAEDVFLGRGQSAGDRPGVRLGDDLLELLGVGVTVVERSEEEPVVSDDARLEVAVDVVLVEDAEAVADADVVRDVAGLGIERLPALGRVAGVAEAAVLEGQDLVLVLHDLDDLGHHLGALELDEGVVAVGIDRPGERHGLLVPGAVRGVAVDEEERDPSG